MLTEVRESLKLASESGFLSQENDYPIAELLVCTGFLLILAVECIAHKFLSHREEDAAQDESFSIESPTGVKVKLPRITGLTPKTSQATNLEFNDAVYAITPAKKMPSLQVPDNTSACFSNQKKVLFVKKFLRF